MSLLTGAFECSRPDSKMTFARSIILSTDFLLGNNWIGWRIPCRDTPSSHNLSIKNHRQEEEREFPVSLQRLQLQIIESVFIFC
jgi:hypothetical protein